VRELVVIFTYSMRLFGVASSLAVVAIGAFAASPIRLLQSLSGPSGKTIGADFVLDEARNRFVFPKDNALVVYFKWEAPAGDHVLTGVWKQPDGRTSSISPDVKIQTTTTALSCYWIFSLTPELPNGVWTLEVRIDGQPAGSHAFEIAGMDTRARQLTVDQIFKTIGTSLVWIRKLDERGHRSDATTGFIIQSDTIATAFQSIDSASELEIEFSDGRKVRTKEVLAASRTGDWAILRADTASLPAVLLGDPKEISVGERLAAFNVDSNARVIGVVDVGGQSTVPGYGVRIQIEPAVSSEAVGGPLVGTSGRVLGILGGSLTQGAKIEPRAIKASPGLWTLIGTINSATAISEVPPSPKGQVKSLDQLAREGVLTPAIAAMPEFAYGGTAASVPKRATDPSPPDSSEFSRREPFVNVYSVWQRKAKLSRGQISVSICDAENHVRGTVPPKKITLRDEPTRVSFAFVPASLLPGIYRIDVLWDGRPAWRTFIRISE
jgi:S1-C subfamily serine protease